MPTCSSVSRDEAVLVALCGLAQADHDRPLLASLDIMMAPTASRVAAIRLKAFAVALAGAGLRLAPAAAPPPAVSIESRCHDPHRCPIASPTCSTPCA